MVQFGDVQLFLQNNDVGPGIRPKLLEILTDTQKQSQLRIELAAVVDLGQHFVKATYQLEGDGPIVFECYQVIATLSAVVHTAHYPNVNAIARDIAPSSQPDQQQWLNYATTCLQPGIHYFLEKFGDDSQCPLAAFKAARLFSPSKIYEIQPIAQDVDVLSVFPFLNESAILANMKAELPTYLAKAANVCPDFDTVEWWSRNEQDLPHWSSVAQKVLLLQPSTAAAERVFSILSSSFSDQQQNSLEDYVEALVMLQYNHW